MNQSLKLLLLGTLFLSGCASTEPAETPNNITVYNVQLEKPSPRAQQTECDSLLDECAVVVETQQKAIEDQKKLIDLQTQQVQAEQAAKEHAQSASKTWTILSIIEGAALALLILL